uniref:Glutamate-rich WD repeat-containing protein 1 n=1 Tax=Trichuris muris TaxID=70415 RepID=A0A5S6QG13_TRIMR
MTTDDATKTLNLTAFLAEQRPRTVGKAVAPKPGLNTEVISPDGSRLDLTGPHRCLGRGGRASPEGQNWLAGPQQQDTYRSADDEPRGGSKASLNVFLAPGRLATGDCRRNIHLWKLVEGGTWQVDQRAFKKHEDSVEDIRWSKSEQSVFFSCSSDRSIKIWDARAKPDNACMFDLQNAHDSDVNVIDVSNTQQLLISGGDDGAVKIWDLRTIKEANPVAVFKYHQGPINSVEWCPHERGVFAASSEDDVVTLWDLTADAINFTEHENLKNVPPQLLFIHLGQREVKEVHWHPSCEGVLFSTAINGFNIAKTISV